MRKIFAIIIIACALGAVAQNIGGDWSGDLKVTPEMSLKVVFHIVNDSTITMDSPDQNAYGMPGKVVYLSPDSLSVSLPRLSMTYNGRLNGNTITGTFSQGWAKMPLVLTPGYAKARRPQTPAPPYPYTTEEVTIANGDVMLAGTLTIPANAGKKTPVVVMVTGSGQQNRDEELFEHKPFAVIADYLARHGIASLRYDDRGYGVSTAPTEAVTSATTATLATDAKAVADYLRAGGRFGKIGLLGHSEGGMIAYMLGAEKGIIDFIVSVAGPTVPGTVTSGYQNKVVALERGADEATATDFGNAVTSAFEYRLKNDAVTEDVQSVIALVYPQYNQSDDTEKLADIIENILTNEVENPWLDFYLDYDPAADIKALKIPAFLIYGEKDKQVPPSLNADKARTLLPKNTVKVYDSLNHMMQHAATGSVAEYKTIEETFALEVLTDIVTFINSLK